jgi:hypothetical protein
MPFGTYLYEGLYAPLFPLWNPAGVLRGGHKRMGMNVGRSCLSLSSQKFRDTLKIYVSDR